MDLSLHRFLISILVGCVSSSLDSSPSNGTGRSDYCVLGAGPAGLQMGYFLSRANRDYVILERNEGPGSFFSR